MHHCHAAGQMYLGQLGVQSCSCLANERLGGLVNPAAVTRVVYTDGKMHGTLLRY